MIYAVFYKKWVDDPTPRGYSDYEDFVEIFSNKETYDAWMDYHDHMRKANYRGKGLVINKIETYKLIGELDVPIECAASATRVDKNERAERKAELLEERKRLDKELKELE